MTKYFSQDTPLAGLERMMMSVPGFQKRGGGMMVLCRFHYKKEDVDCTYCRSYMRHTCQESVCPYIPERLEAGTIGYQELAERCLRMAGHQKLWKRASSLSKGNTLPLALEPAHRHRLSEWPEAGTASICPQKLAAVYLLSSRIGLWRRVLPHISHGRIDFSSVSLRGIDPRDYPVYRAAKGLYCGKLLITSAELADEEQVSSEAFGDILNAMLIARYPPYGEAQARELIDCLREIAPYVVIDCGSYIANDILSAVALMEADSVLRLANADLKSISYLSSQLPLLKDAKWDTDKQYKIAANVKPQQAGEQIGQALGNVAFILPHSEELEAQFLAGILLSDLTMKESRSFRKEIEQVCREVFSC